MFGKSALILTLSVMSLTLWGQDASIPALVIHGGAGIIRPGEISAEREAGARSALQAALDSGYAILQRGGEAIDAVEAAIVLLENNPEFNSGRGAVMTAEGHHELDASIMNGQDLMAGAVAGVQHVKNPIRAALAVMRHSPHVILAGKGADEFAADQGLDTVPNDYFTTKRIKDLWQKSQDSRSGDAGEPYPSKYGTVGAVAIDKNGNIAAGTSTGGMMNGRIGDSPIIGAGTYADNATCGVSCTGHGEYFIRIGVAKEISDRMAFGHQSLSEAANDMIHEKLKDHGGEGGLIAIDHLGNIEMTFNTAGMFRGYINQQGSKVKIYGDD